MSSRLVNVRLDAERLRKVKALRAGGIAISDLLREAIDERYARNVQPGKGRDIAAIMRKLDEQFPISLKDMPRRSYNVHDRKEAAAAIRRHLKRKKATTR